MLGSSKVIVIEEEPQIRGIPSAPTSVAGAVGVTERGPIGEATLVTSFEEFEAVFGSFVPGADLPLAAVGFFQNGGRELWVVRTVHYGDVADPETATTTRAVGLLTASVEGGEPQPAVRVEARDPGSYGTRLQLEVRPAVGNAPAAFDLAVIQDGSHRELWSNLSLDPASPRLLEWVVNDPRTGSKLVRVKVESADTHPTLDPQTAELSGGTDGLDGLIDLDFVGSEVGKTGLHALDRAQELSLLIVPGRATPAAHQAMVHYAEAVRGGTVFAILDPPQGANAQAAVAYVEGEGNLLGLSEYAAIFWPWVKVMNPKPSVFGQAETVVAPPSGVVAGVFARTDSSHPGGIYDPPAGIEKGRMLGVLGFESDEVLEETKRDLVYPKRINPLTTGPGLPRFIDGSRTLKADGNFPFVAERRGVIFIERSLRQGLQFARHRSNTEELRAQVRRTIATFLLNQMNAGAFRSREPEKAFFVDVSDELNPPSVVLEGKLIARVGLATSKPAEFVVIKVSQDLRAVGSELTAAGL